MRITFENNTQQNTERVTTANSSTRTQERERTGAFTADISGTVMDNNAYGVQGRTAEDVMQDAQGTDVATQRNYMAVMSNSMSTEDFSKLLKEGVNPNDTEIETVVTIVDRMKAELVQAGVSVSGYTDSLDMETLTRIVGSEGLAKQLSDTFVQNDIPVTEENVEAAIRALQEAGELSKPTDGELKYLVNNGMEPTIENLYMAEHSGAVDADRQGKGYYQENYGYYAKKAEAPDFEKLLPQIEKIITEAGLSVTDQTIEQAEWMVEKGIPLTAENLSCLYMNQKVSFPLQEETVVQAIAGALTEGKSPLQANLAEPKNKYQKATEMSEIIDKWIREDSLSVTARRQLEEIRLRMSAEVNVRLAESDFSIDTTDMEALVEALKEAEERQAQKLFPGQEPEQRLESLQLYQDTLAKTAILPGVPAAVLGRILFEEKLAVNVENLVREGSSLQEDYRKAGEAYEALMTAPRKDLGDSIRKAFGNVDDILKDLKYELTPENQRAVRILAYNQLPVTPENLEQVRAADRRIQRVIRKMTPASTLKMIRDGVNPLKTDLKDLEQYFKDQADEPGQKMETYSRYLYRLEKNQEITPEERDAYIGVYRLLRQIEKSDGAVIGSVLKAQSELNFKQLLTAARTAKKAGMNILVDETFGGLSELHTKGIAIDQQINAIDSGNREESAADAEDYEEYQESEQELETIRSLKTVESDVLRTLNQLDLPCTVNYIRAAAALTESGSPLFSYLKGRLAPSSAGKENVREEEKEDSPDFDQLTDALTDALTDRETMQEAYQQFSTQVTELLQEKLYTPGQTSLDIKTMKSACLQLSVAAKLAQEETYEIPLQVRDGITAIRLTIRHQAEENGQASISMETEKYGRIQTFIQIRKDEVSGYITGKPEAVSHLEDLKEELNTAFSNKGLRLKDFQVVAAESRYSFRKLEETDGRTSARRIYEAAREVVRALQTLND